MGKLQGHLKVFLSSANQRSSRTSVLLPHQPPSSNKSKSNYAWQCWGLTTALLVIVIGSFGLVWHRSLYYKNYDSSGILLLNDAWVHSSSRTATTGNGSKSFTTKTTTIPSFVGFDENDVTKQRQIENFRNGQGILLNFHITHHGGTTFCREIGRHLKRPSFACLEPEPQDNVTMQDVPILVNNNQQWTYNNTGQNIDIVRRYFDMMAWEFEKPADKDEPQIPDTNWEHPKLVSVIVMRDPISRLLAGDALVKNKYPTLKSNGTLDQWWEFAQDDHFTDNYAMRILAGYPCCQGNRTDPLFLGKAKSLVRRFTFVLDIECLDAGMYKLAKLLGFPMDKMYARSRSKNIQHAPSRERIGYPEVYEYLVKKNHLDIQLYNWAKNLALVNCSAWEQRKSERRKQLVP